MSIYILYIYTSIHVYMNTLDVTIEVIVLILDVFQNPKASKNGCLGYTSGSRHRPPFRTCGVLVDDDKLLP